MGVVVVLSREAVSMLRSLTLWVILGVTLSLAAPQSGKVRSVLGDVSFKKKGKGDWASLRVGAKVQEKDVIQTEIESGVLISMPDGSTISIEENALVEFSQILMIKDSQVSEVEVKKGMLRFDAQKQKGPQSKFRFRTGTATASIRGTDGVIGVTEGGLPYGALNTGEMVMEEDGKEISVKAQQYVAFRKGQAPVVVEAKNAGDLDFIKTLSAAVDDTAKSVEDIQASAREIDAKIEKRNEDLRLQYKCRLYSVPPVISTNTVTIEALCSPGVTVSLGSETFESSGQTLRFTPSWADGAFGEKKFRMTCSVEKNTFECGNISFVYRVDRRIKFMRYDEHKCEALYATTGFNGNDGKLRVYVGDSLLRDLMLERDIAASFPLLPGVNTYRIVPENEDSSVGVIERELKCFPKTGVKIQLRNGNKAVFKKKVSQGAAVYPELEFDVVKVVNNDPSQIKSVEASVNGKPCELKMIPSESGLGYSTKLQVRRGKSTKVDIKVTMLSGEVAKESKIFEYK